MKRQILFDEVLFVTIISRTSQEMTSFHDVNSKLSINKSTINRRNVFLSMFFLVGFNGLPVRDRYIVYRHIDTEIVITEM